MPSFFLNNTTSVTSNGTIIDQQHTGASLRVDYQQNSDTVTLSMFNTTGSPAFGLGATEASLTGVAFDVADSTNALSVLAKDTNTLVTNVAGSWNANVNQNFGFAPFTGAFDWAIGKLPSVGGNVNLFKVVSGDDLDLDVKFATSNEAQTWYNSLKNDDIRFAARFQQVNVKPGSDKLYYVTNGKTQAVPESSGAIALLLIGLAAIAWLRPRATA